MTDRPTYSTSWVRAATLAPGDVVKLGGQLLSKGNPTAPWRRGPKEPRVWRMLHARGTEQGDPEPGDPEPAQHAVWIVLVVDAGDPLDGYTRTCAQRLRPYDLVQVQVERAR